MRLVIVCLLTNRHSSTGKRSSGGVANVDISRMPVTAISSVRGIGVGTLYADVRKGNRPSFVKAGAPAHAERRNLHLPVQKFPT